MISRITLLALTAAIFAAAPVAAQDSVVITHTLPQLEKLWRARIETFLARGIIPLVDLESSLKRKDAERYLNQALEVMDDLGLALIAFDGFQAPGSDKNKGKGYRWGYDIHKVVNAHPDRFVLATNGGTNKNWLEGKGNFTDQVVEQVRSGTYPIMGEFDFCHYMSNSQCKKGRTDRDSEIPLDGEDGQRLFQLSEETGVPFVIHLEAEDGPLDALERMLGRHPRAQAIVAHFGQIRHPARQRRFGPALVRRLLATYPNLYYDLATGQPNRRYACNNDVFDTVIWRTSAGRQSDTLGPEYKAILTDFSRRFVVGTDYGGGRATLPSFLRQKVGNIRLILRDLPDRARHDIGYRNAWRLLTGKPWQ